MEYDNEMTAVLFPNDKGDNPKRPDYWGRLTLGGNEYKLAGWKKTNDKGVYLSLKVETDEKAPTAAPASQPTPPSTHFGDVLDDDDIPF